MDISTYLDQFLSNFSGTLPKIGGALLVIIIGGFLAKIIRNMVKKGLNTMHLDSRLGASATVSLEKLISNLVYYFIQIYAFIIALDILGVQGVLEPLKNMLNNFTSYIPNIVGAGVIGYIGYALANIASEATSSTADYLDGLFSKIDLQGKINIVKLVKQIVFLIVFVPILIVALNTLKISTISEPATAMLQQMLEAIPMILSAAILIGVFYIVGKFASTWLGDLVKSMGGNDLASKLGISGMLGSNTLSGIVSKLVFFFIMFTGIIAGVDKLNIPEFSAILMKVFNISGQVLFAVVIIIIGNYLATLVKNNMLAKNNSNETLATIVQYSILGLFLAMALRGIGIADSIVDLAFGLILGAIAVAFALSFGLGGREAASKFLNDKLKK